MVRRCPPLAWGWGQQAGPIIIIPDMGERDTQEHCNKITKEPAVP